MIIGITWESLNKIHLSIFEYLINKVGPSFMPIEINGDLYLLKIHRVKILKNLCNLISKKQIFQIKIVNKSDFFPIIIFILIQSKVITS